jgi:S1-C subfamily serine protease
LLPSKVIAAERAPTSIVARATSRGRQETTTKEEEPTSAPNNNNNNRQSPRDVWSGVKKAISSADMDEVRLGLPGFGAITARDRKMGTSSFVRDAVRTVGSAVVRVDCEREVSPMQMMLQPGMYQEGDTIKVSGSGFVASTGEEDGRGGGGVLILTNQHVIDSSKKSTVSLANGRTYRCSVVAEDELTDLAVLKVDVPVEEAKQLALAPLGDSSTLQSGDWVIAVGCPVGLDFSCSLGIVSSPLRSASEVGATHLKGTYIQTDAALNSGNSGGPLVNDKGEVVGINTMVRTNTEAIGFAIPINRARAIFEVLRQGKKPTHAYFGLEVSSITPDFAKIHNDDPNAQRLPQVHGALVRKVLPGSPAASCGLRRNDIIIEVNGKSVSGTHDADGYLDSCEPGKVATIKVARGEDGREFVIKATPQNLLSMIEEKRRKRAGQASSR